MNVNPIAATLEPMGCRSGDEIDRLFRSIADGKACGGVGDVTCLRPLYFSEEDGESLASALDSVVKRAVVVNGLERTPLTFRDSSSEVASASIMPLIATNLVCGTICRIARIVPIPSRNGIAKSVSTSATSSLCCVKLPIASVPSTEVITR